MSSLDQSRRAADRAARESYGRLVALLSSITRDVASAEDALAEAFAAALRQWPAQGVPHNPEGWLLAVARRRLIDSSRRRGTNERFQDHLKLISEELDAERETSREIPDRRVALMFACAHPEIEPSIRTPLILQTILGFTAEAIAAAFLVPPATMAQRLVRAKARIKQSGIPFAVPERADLPGRLDAVLQAVYAAYSRDWAEAAEDTEDRLSDEAIWLGQVTAELIPDQAEVKGLLALMLFLDARRGARSAADGSYVPLDEQDTARWNLAQIRQAEALMKDANRMEGAGRFQIEAAIQSAHVARRLHGVDSRPDIVALYDVLFTLVPTPVVALNRLVARSRISGADEVLDEIRQLGADASLIDYQPYWAARGMLLAEAGRNEEAREALTAALGLATDEAARAFLQRRIARLPGTPGGT
ncbi:MAG: RNA polymerase subunit sigma-70 [Aquamicrobium sp.]|nr:RNA polymerase subunit sigma-70 [Aquamicrobium sp.]